MGILNGLFGRELGTGRKAGAETRERPGWDAITVACEQLYPDQTEPFHVGTLVSSFLGGVDPLEGISVYRADKPCPHWHYVTYGLSDLYGEQEGSGDGVSGYGFELTFRLVDDGALKAKEPPTWPLSLLQNLARYVFRTGNGFAPNHHIDANGPISLEEETTQTALGFIEDPDLGSVETPSGSVQFVQLVGLTAEDLDDVNNWDAEKFFALLTGSRPKGITELRGGPLRADPEIATRITEGRKKDGSQMGQVFIDVLRITAEAGMPMLTIGARVAGVLGERLNSRLPHGREFLLHSPDGTCSFCLVVAPGFSWGTRRPP